jgi:hypothetical protein
MKSLRNFTSAAVLTVGIVLAASAAKAAPWVEADHGDAGGTLATAQVLTGGPWDFLSNEVTPVTDVSDFFLFYWGGGKMGLNVVCADGCGVAAVTVVGRVFNSGGVKQMEVYYTTEETEPSPGSFVELAATNYYLEIAIETISGEDPPISSAIFRLDGETTVILMPFLAAVPEPALIGLFGLALAGLGLARRRR